MLQCQVRRQFPYNVGLGWFEVIDYIHFKQGMLTGIYNSVQPGNSFLTMGDWDGL